MSALGDALIRPALSVDGRDLTVADVAVAALYLGEWSVARARVEVGLACARPDGAFPAPDDEVAVTAEAFRRERRLLAAEEMEEWLARRGLSAGEWMRWVRMDVGRRHVPRSSDGGHVSVEAAELYAEALCSGALRRAARWLAETLVAPAPEAPANGARGRMPDAGELEVLGIDPAQTATLLEELRGRATAVSELASRVAGAEAVAARVRAQQADWLAIEYRMLALPQQAAACEAVLCVRDDGMQLEEVAQLAGVDVVHEHALLCDVPPALATQLLSASRGELIGPVEHGDATAVVVLDAKVAPSPDDPEIARRARRELLTRALDREMATRVRWHDRL
jgi:hypothetical protein